MELLNNNHPFSKVPDTYELIEYRYVEEMHSYAAILSHKKTKARVLLVSNDDTNKVFNIAFRTPVSDCTGVPHIIEHTVLCGSELFPSKDPFVELVKGSLNTFLNAMTYSDKTMYPVASYNDKDFQNLMHVYLDAVFYPNIYKNKMIFEQEGWHYELDTPESPLTINGVVYNEMKGAFSSPEQVLFREISTTLFPDTNYANESGGDPDCIPSLSYEAYLDFHRKYYHPTNSYIYLYGDFDIAQKLQFIDENYLSKFDYQPVDSKIVYQMPFDSMRHCEKAYSIGSEDDVKDHAYLSYNAVIGTSLDKTLYLAFQILDYVLMGAPGAVLKQALLKSEIAKDIFSTYDNGILQPYYAIVAKDTNPEEEEAFLAIIKNTLEDLVKNGINKKSIEAALNYFEFKFREANFGRYPKGLMYGLQMFDSWLYDDASPLMHIEAFETFNFLRQAIETDYFEQLIETYLLKNPHRSMLVLKPEQGLNSKKEKELEEKLAAYKASLNEDEMNALIEHTKALKSFQETPSTPEELEKIPMIEISDISREIKAFKNDLTKVNDLPILKHDIETNGINYFSMLFEIKDMPEQMIPYLGLMHNLLGNMDTLKYTYAELSDEINMYTGGITTDITHIGNDKNPESYRVFFVATGKALYDRSENLVSLMKEMLFNTQFTDERRLKEVIGQMRSRLATSISESGHMAAVLRANSYFNENSYIKDTISGLAFYDFICNIDDQFDELKEQIIGNLKAVCHFVLRKENVLLDLTSANDGFEALSLHLTQLDDAFYTDSIKKEKISFKPEHKNEGIMTPGMVSYDAIAGNFLKKGYKYHGALQILKVIMNYDYLWTNIRVLGGAYGCMASFSSNGCAAFVTYRDPNVKESFDIFKKAAEYIRNFECSQRDMTKYIIGAISNIDTPLTPSSEGARSLSMYLSGISEETVKERRLQLLDATVETIRSFGDLIDSFVSDDYICVIGSESQIKANKDMFNSLRHI